MFGKPYSEKTAETIDQEVKAIIEEAYQRAKQILTENRDGLNKLSELLLEREVIFSEDLEAIFGKRKGAKEELISAKPIAETPKLEDPSNPTEENASEEKS
jgi:cell division protease FtsH